MMQQSKAPPKATQADLDQLGQELRKRQQSLYKDLEKVKESEQEKAYREIGSKLFSEFGPRFEAIARQSTGGLQVRARIAMISLAEQAQKDRLADQILGDILKQNLDLAETAQVVLGLRYNNSNPKKKKQLPGQLAAFARSKNTSVQAAALYVRAEVTKDTDAKASVPLYKQLMVQYPTSEFAKRATTSIFEAENLQIGMLAPEILGTDHEDKPFKLSEYRGKVVVLDFWGFW
jgi:hypothetical protein